MNIKQDVMKNNVTKLVPALLFMMLTYFSANGQMHFGASVKNLNMAPVGSTISSHTTLDYLLTLTYRSGEFSFGLDWGRVARVNRLSAGEIETQNDKLTASVNYLPLKNSAIVPGLGFGYYVKRPYNYETSQDLQYNEFFNSGLHSNVSLNIPGDLVYISAGLFFDVDITNSLDDANLMLFEYGPYLSAHINLGGIFKK